MQGNNAETYGTKCQRQTGNEEKEDKDFIERNYIETQSACYVTEVLLCLFGSDILVY